MSTRPASTTAKLLFTTPLKTIAAPISPKNNPKVKARRRPNLSISSPQHSAAIADPVSNVAVGSPAKDSRPLRVAPTIEATVAEAEKPAEPSDCAPNRDHVIC